MSRAAYMREYRARKAARGDAQGLLPFQKSAFVDVLFAGRIARRR